MPIYEYECEQCGERTEVLQRVGAPPIGSCEACGGVMKRLVSAPAFQFKGTGWYVTDYAKKGKSDNGAGPTESSGKKGGEKSSSAATSDGEKSTSTKSGKDSSTSGSAKESSGAGS